MTTRCYWNWASFAFEVLKSCATSASQYLPPGAYCTVEWPAKLRERGSRSHIYSRLVTPDRPGPLYVTRCTLWDSLGTKELSTVVFVVPSQDPGQKLDCYRAKFDAQLSLYVVSTLVLPSDAPEEWSVPKPSHPGNHEPKCADEDLNEHFPGGLSRNPYWEDQSQYDLGLFAVRDPYSDDFLRNISILQAQLEKGCEIDLKVLNDLLKPQSFDWADELDDLEASALQAPGVAPSAQQDGNSQHKVAELLQRKELDWSEEVEEESEESPESTPTPPVVLRSQNSAPSLQPEPLQVAPAPLEPQSPPQLPSEEIEVQPEEEGSDGDSDLEEGASGISHDSLSSEASRRFQESDTSPEPMSSPAREPSSDAESLEPDVNTKPSGRGHQDPINVEDASEESQSAEPSSQASQGPQLSLREMDDMLRRKSFDWADECDVEVEPPLQSFHVAPGSDESSTEEYVVEEEYGSRSPTPSEVSQENSSEPREKLWNETAFMEAEKEYAWQTSMFQDYPDIHHFNWFGNPVMDRSDTPPEVSLFIILMGAKAYLIEDYEEPTRQGIVLKQAMKYVDPVIFDGVWWAFEFKGHSLMKAITGSVHTFYTGAGIWAQDPVCTRDNSGWYDPMNPGIYLSQRGMPFNGWFRTRFGRTRQDFFDEAKRMNTPRKWKSDQEKAGIYKRSPLSSCLSAETGEVSHAAEGHERFVCGEYQFLAHPGDVDGYDPSSFYDIRLTGGSSSQQDLDEYDSRPHASNAFVPGSPSSTPGSRWTARSTSQEESSGDNCEGLPSTPNVSVPRPPTPAPDTQRPTS